MRAGCRVTAKCLTVVAVRYVHSGISTLTSQQTPQPHDCCAALPRINASPFALLLLIRWLRSSRLEMYLSPCSLKRTSKLWRRHRLVLCKPPTVIPPRQWLSTILAHLTSKFNLVCSPVQGIIDSYNEIAGLSISGKPAVIRLNHPTVWVYSEDSQCAGQHVLVEPFIEKYEKFNSNSGWADMNDGWPAVMQASCGAVAHTSTAYTHGKRGRMLARWRGLALSRCIAQGIDMWCMSTLIILGLG